MPAECSQPLRVRIRYEGTLSGDTYLARGERLFDPASGDTIRAYRLHSASDSSGYLVAEIASIQEGAPRPASGIHLPGEAANGAADALELLGLKGYGTRETGHFAIHYPQDVVTVVSIPTVGIMLEEIYGAVANDLQLPWLWVSRVQTVIMDIGTGRGAYCGFTREVVGPVLDLSRTSLSDGNFTPVRLDADMWLPGPGAGCI